MSRVWSAEKRKYCSQKGFDETLEKYKPKSALSTITPVTPIQKSKPKLDELWHKYSEYEKPHVSPSTYVKVFTKQKSSH